MRSSDSFTQNLRRMRGVFLSSLPSLLLFEIVFKLLSLFLFVPAGKKIIAMMMDIRGDSMLFNYQMLKLVFSLPGIAAIVLILCLSALVSYFEFSVIIIKLSDSFHGQNYTLSKTMRRSAVTFMPLSGLGIIGFFIYSILLLPFEAIYIAPSVMPHVQIPNFITGEFVKSWYGRPVLNIAYTVFFILFFILLFVLWAMVLKGLPFFKACVQSIKMWKNTKAVHILFILFFIVLWAVLFIWPGFIPTDFSALTEENTLKTISMLFFSEKRLLSAIQACGVWLLKTMLMLLFMSFLTVFYLNSNPGAGIEERLVSLADGKIDAAKSLVSRLYLKIAAYFKPLTSRVNISKKTLAVCTLLCCGIFVIFMYHYAQTPPPLHEPLTIGHRGSDIGVENTMEAVNGAISSDADFVELDIQITKDNIPVAIHDGNLIRLAGSFKKVHDLTYEQLHSIPLKQYGKTGFVPSLEDIMKNCKGKIQLLIEFKAESEAEKAPLVKEVLKLIEKYDFQDECILMSIDYSLVAMARQINPDLKIGYCMFGSLGEITTEDLIELNVDFFVIEENMVSKEIISACRRAWLPVYVWTVDNEDNMRKYLEMGVIGLISDKPYAVRDIVGDFQNSSGISGVDYYFKNSGSR